MDYKKELRKLWDRQKGPYQKLSNIEFNKVGMRGVKNFSIDFKYPITAIAGANGIGKTTILQVAACLFHNNDKEFHPYRFSNAKNQPSYYKITDFFVISRGESTGIGTKIKFNFYKPGETRTEYAIRKNSRWSNYERRPIRYVDFLGISRVLPAYEFAELRKTFGGEYITLETNSLDEGARKCVGRITGKTLLDISEDRNKRVRNFTLSRITVDTEGLEYSSFNMGAGEEVAITLISRISSLPEGSLVLVEEIELGLHPRAQKELIDSLMKIIFDKRIQLIFTTHSPFIFDVLPPDAKILLRKTTNNIETIYAPSNSLAFIELTGSDHNDLTIYLEDEIAKQLVEYLFNASVSKRIQIIDVGSKENVIRMTASHYINDQLGKAIGVPDGDATDKEMKGWCSKYMLKNGENCSEEDFQSKKIYSFRTLPSNTAPELYILTKLKSDIDFIEDIDDSEEFKSFIQNQIDISDDHHALFYKISEFLSKGEEGIKRDILRFVARHYKNEFQAIIDLVNEKLGEI